MVRVCSFFLETTKLPLKWLYHFAVLPVENESSWCFTPMSAFSVVSALDLGHSNRCRMIAHYFDLHFPDDTWQAASFHMLIFHLYIFFGEVSAKCLGPFFNWSVVFLLAFKSSLNILDYSLLSECLCKYFLLVYGLFSHSLNIVFHRAVSILMISNLSVIHFIDNAIDIVLPYPRSFIFSHLLYLELLFYICILQGLLYI